MSFNIHITPVPLSLVSVRVVPTSSSGPSRSLLPRAKKIGITNEAVQLHSLQSKIQYLAYYISEKNGSYGLKSAFEK